MARTNRYIRDEVNDDDVEYTPVSNRDTSNNWLPLLLIPLFLLLALGAYTLYRSNGTAPYDGTTPGGNNGIQYGVGGGPLVITPTVTPTQAPVMDDEVSPTSSAPTDETSPTLIPMSP